MTPIFDAANLMGENLSDAWQVIPERLALKSNHDIRVRPQQHVGDIRAPLIAAQHVEGDQSQARSSLMTFRWGNRAGRQVAHHQHAVPKRQQRQNDKARQQPVAMKHQREEAGKQQERYDMQAHSGEKGRHPVAWHIGST